MVLPSSPSRSWPRALSARLMFLSNGAWGAAHWIDSSKLHPCSELLIGLRLGGHAALALQLAIFLVMVGQHRVCGIRATVRDPVVIGAGVLDADALRAGLVVVEQEVLPVLATMPRTQLAGNVDAARGGALLALA